MIVIDIETSGLEPVNYGIVEIGALKFENPKLHYSGLCRLDDEDKISDKALDVNGQTKEEVRDLKRNSQEQILSEFFDWTKGLNDFYAAGENIGFFDLNFMKVRADKYGLKFPFQYRSFDLHSIASLKYGQVFGELPVIDGKTKIGLTQILEFVGLEDNRGKHNALEDAMLEAECFSRLIFGRGLFEGFSKFLVPDYLRRRDDRL